MGETKRRRALRELVADARTRQRHRGEVDRASLAKAMLEPTVTGSGASLLSELWRCPRAAYLRTLKLRPRMSSGPLQVGSLCHSAINYMVLCAAHNATGDWSDVLEHLEPGSFDAEAIAETSRLMAAYVERYADLRAATLPEAALVLGVEHLVTTTAFGYGPSGYSARLDVFYLDSESGRVCVMDHKTIRALPSADDETLTTLWRTKQQFLGHSALVREVYGERPVIEINWIAKTKVPGFRRLAFEHSDREIDLWITSMRAVRRLKLLEHAPTLANYDQCAPSIGDPCWAFQFCHDLDEGAEERLHDVYTFSAEAMDFRKQLEEEQ